MSRLSLLLALHGLLCAGCPAIVERSTTPRERAPVRDDEVVHTVGPSGDEATTAADPATSDAAL